MYNPPGIIGMRTYDALKCAQWILEEGDDWIMIPWYGLEFCWDSWGKLEVRNTNNGGDEGTSL